MRASARTERRVSFDVEQLSAELADVRRRLAALEARHARRGPRDRDDIAAVRAVRAALERLEVERVSRVGLMRFTAKAVCRHARVDAALRVALEAGDWDARSLGLCLGRCSQLVIDGRVLVRLGLTNQGWAWKFLPA